MNPNTDFVPFSRPVLGPEEEAAVLEVLRSGWLTTGKVAAAFEAEFAAYCAVKHALAVNSATAGLHLALEALGVGSGDVCAVPDMTFTATAEVVRYLGADVAFVDCQSKSANLDLAALERVLKRTKVKVVLPVHLGGEPVDWAQLSRLKERYGFFVVEDAAHAFPARSDAGLLGTLGDLGVYSFYANKNMTTGEGGMIVTSNDAWAQRIKVMRLHGIDRDAFARFTAQAASWEYAIVAPGYKYNLTDIAAAIGREQLKKVDAFWRERQRVVRAYGEALRDVEEIETPEWREDHAWHLYAIELRLDLLSIDRNVFLRRLGELGVGTSVHYIPLHRMPYWKQRYGLEDAQFPFAQRRFERLVSLPLYPALTEAQIGRVVDAVKTVCAQGRIPRG